MRIITEPEFKERLFEVLKTEAGSLKDVGYVTGPGRSGAIAAVYASHMLGVPFIPFGLPLQPQLGRCLLIDTARQSGETMHKAIRRYKHADPIALVLFEEPPRVAFWYEAQKPQHYRHEIMAQSDGSLQP